MDSETDAGACVHTRAATETPRDAQLELEEGVHEEQPAAHTFLPAGVTPVLAVVPGGTGVVEGKHSQSRRAKYRSERRARLDRARPEVVADCEPGADAAQGIGAAENRL